MKDDMKALLEKQQYAFAGDHSAVKICSWTKKSLRNEGVCYKESFYGIRTHLCCQMTPSVGYCQNRCVFCWRDLDDSPAEPMNDSPEEIYDGCIKGQRFLISGFGGNPKTDMNKFKEAQEPMHFAISLTGEPTLYPKLSELIEYLHSKGKTTFLVSNGLIPNVIRNIVPPTQLYISVDAPSEELFYKVDRPLQKKGAWEKLLETLDILKEIKNKTRTTLRMTIIKDINMENPKGWADAIIRSEPMFVEVKAYMFVGSSRDRLSLSNMPRHHEIKAFAEEIAKESGYKIIDERVESRVVLLMKEDFSGRIMKFD